MYALTLKLGNGRRLAVAIDWRSWTAGTDAQVLRLAPLAYRYAREWAPGAGALACVVGGLGAVVVALSMIGGAL